MASYVFNTATGSACWKLTQALQKWVSPFFLICSKAEPSLLADVTQTNL